MTCRAQLLFRYPSVVLDTTCFIIPLSLCPHVTSMDLHATHVSTHDVYERSEHVLHERSEQVPVPSNRCGSSGGRGRRFPGYLICLHLFFFRIPLYLLIRLSDGHDDFKEKQWVLPAVLVVNMLSFLVIPTRTRMLTVFAPLEFS